MGQRWFLVVAWLVVFGGWAGAQKAPAFSSEERAYLEKISAQGGLKAGIRGYETALPLPDAGTSFHRDLFLAFTRWLGVKGTVRNTTVAEIFGDGKTIPPAVYDNPNLRYDPAIFSTADLVLGSLTPLSWRNRIMTVVPVIPSSVVLVVRKEAGISTLGSLDGHRVLVQTGSSFEDLWKSIQAEQKIRVKALPVSLDDRTLAALALGKADGVLEDSFDVFPSIRSFPSLKVLQPVSDIHYVGWGLKKGNDVLAGLLTRFLRESSGDGTLDRLVSASLGVDLKAYFAVLGFRPGQQVYNLLLTLEERRYLEDLQARGTLKMATMVSDLTYKPLDDGRIVGFDYHLAKAFSQALGVRLEVQPQNNPQAFFARNGVFDPAVVDDPKVSYDPDLLSKVDLYAAPFALLPWRQKLTLMVPILPYGNIIVGKNAEKVLKYKDLEGKRIAEQAGTYQEQMVKDLMAREGFRAEVVTYANGENPLALIQAGKADLTIDGVQFFAAGMDQLKKSKLAVSPLKIDGGTVAWAVARNNPLLASILKKYMIFSQSDGTFSQIFQEQNGMDFSFYLELLGT